ncbi:MAG: sulfatase-like hydrolase/transferase [Burkholderiales bacterium]
MIRNRYHLVFLASLLALTFCGRERAQAVLGQTPAPVSAADARPNIIFILADDLGWSDLACYGADLHETPHLDRLARAGVRFTQAYAMPVCSPTRAALLTGKHAARLRFTVWRESSVNRDAEAAASRNKLLPPATAHDLARTTSYSSTGRGSLMKISCAAANSAAASTACWKGWE